MYKTRLSHIHTSAFKKWISNTVTKASFWRNSSTGCPLPLPNSSIFLRGGRRSEWKWRGGTKFPGQHLAPWSPAYGGPNTHSRARKVKAESFHSDSLPRCREDSFHPAWNTKRRAPLCLHRGLRWTFHCVNSSLDESINTENGDLLTQLPRVNLS